MMFLACKAWDTRKVLRILVRSVVVALREAWFGMNDLFAAAVKDREKFVCVIFKVLTTLVYN